MVLFSDPGNIGGALIICFYLWNQRNVVECFLGYYRRYVHQHSKLLMWLPGGLEQLTMPAFLEKVHSAHAWNKVFWT